MRTSRHAALPVALLLCLAASPVDAERYLQAEPRVFPLEGATRLRVEFPVGSMTVEGDEGTTVRALVRVDCRRHDTDECARQARRIRVDHRVSDGRLSIDVSGIRKEMTSRISVEMRLLVPRRMQSRFEMGVGNLTVSGMTADLEAELGVGELTIKGEERHFHAVAVESGVGDATIRTRSGDIRERGFIGHTAHWDDGRGASTLSAHVGVGKAEVNLR